ncbi:uncharacterized protein K460DRAFT_286753 [Cucurbitaria berberidis CBS 394.84]|uniref:BTB domain-containing protein n=1 Tax=Cucurbitaria berberidis CBS 394.84 TaxID=1168544 RepID=A0A9P4GHF8_9PLEO|nr:uncharacterized protein K460DRAFT_286753 [Cucurbitaria berberidis CBS 394.84]KAF1845640.1 hypothetical protein K460DRAFT_286753 [Cucurbitaria berberidis CBS 394.84]
MTAKDTTVEVPACIYADAAPPQCSFDSLVIVIVGRAHNKKEFQVHRGLLSHYSIFFEHILRDKSENEIAMPAEDPEVFDTITYWMYTSRLWGPGTIKDGKIPLTVARILQLYFFAGAKGIEALQNATMTLLYQKIVQDWETPIQFASIIYARTVPDSPLRRFLVDFMAEAWSFSTLETYRTTIPKDFLIDLLIALTRLRKAPGIGVVKAKWVQDSNKGFCEKYHSHGEQA